MGTITEAKSPTLTEAASENLRTGVLLLCKEALVTAIQDRRLHRGHLCVLASIATFMSARTAKAWPGRAAIAAWTGLSPKSVSNLLLEMRDFGYLIAARESVEEANNRSLTVYTFGKIDHETLRRQITETINSMRAARQFGENVPSQQEQKSPAPVGQSRPSGTNSPAPVGTLPEKVPLGRVAKSRQGGDSNSMMEQSSNSPNGEGANAPGEAASLRKIIWEHGISYLRKAYGGSVPEADLRSRLGKLIKDHTVGPVLSALDEAQRQEPVDPLDYVQGVLRRKGGQQPFGVQKTNRREILESMKE